MIIYQSALKMPQNRFMTCLNAESVYVKNPRAI